MQAIRWVNQYKVLLYAVVGLAVLSVDPQDTTGALIWCYRVILGLFVVLAVTDFIYHRLSKQRSFKRILKELVSDLFRHRRRAIIVVRNAHLIDLSREFSHAIRAQEWWDWSYVGNNRECKTFCTHLASELGAEYLATDRVNSIQTSSLTLLEEYPFKDRTYIFFGDIIFPGTVIPPSAFPEHIFNEVTKGAMTLSLSKLYIYDTHWRARERQCLPTSARIVRNPARIHHYWDDIENKLRHRLGNSRNLTWTDGPPEASKINRFAHAIKLTQSGECPKSIFIVSPRTGGLRDYAKAARAWGWGPALLVTVGWLLSPLSFFNDAIVNVPIALAISLPIIGIFGIRFAVAITAISYLFTNVMGIVLLYLGIRLGAQRPRWNLHLGKVMVLASLFCVAVGFLVHIALSRWGAVRLWVESAVGMR